MRGVPSPGGLCDRDRNQVHFMVPKVENELKVRFASEVALVLHLHYDIILCLAFQLMLRVLLGHPCWGMFRQAFKFVVNEALLVFYNSASRT